VHRGDTPDEEALPIKVVSGSSLCVILLMTRKFSSGNVEKKLPLTRSRTVTDELEQQLAAYEVWQARQSLADNTCRAYLLQIRQYRAFLAARSPQDGHPLCHTFARDYAARDYKTYLKTQRKVKPTSVNLALAAFDHFYQFLGLDPATGEPRRLSRAITSIPQTGGAKSVFTCNRSGASPAWTRRAAGIVRTCVTPHLPHQLRPSWQRPGLCGKCGEA
jgi:hypothetical protein